MQTETSQIVEIKRAQTENAVNDAIRNRYSGRSFTQRRLQNQEVDTILEAASWAPSSMNEQPWLYKFAENGSPEFAEMFDCLIAGNQIWVKGAAGIILSVARITHQSNGKPNAYAWYDVGAANAYLILQASDLGFTTHIMGGFDHQKANALYAKDSNHQVVCFIAIGEQGDAENLPEPFKTRELIPRDRKKVADLLA